MIVQVNHLPYQVPTQHIVSSNPEGVQRSGTFYISSLVRPFHFADAPSGAHREESSKKIEEVELDEAWDLQLLLTAPSGNGKLLR
jgi:hypothetical protein